MFSIIDIDHNCNIILGFFLFKRHKGTFKGIKTLIPLNT